MLSRNGLQAARESAEQLNDVIAQVTDAQWDLPSACAGWRVIDIIAHLAALAHEAVTPPPPDPSAPTVRERYHDYRVNQRRAYTYAQVIEEWQTYGPRQLDLLEEAQDGERSEETVAVPGLGTYPRHMLANTMAFNVFCHLRNDMLAPDGPLPIRVPAPTDGLVAPAVEFMLAGLPQMQGTELTASVTEPLVLRLTGPGAMTVTVHPADAPNELLTVSSGRDGFIEITSTATDFIRWATQRKHWRDYCQITGDRSAAEPFLDRLNII